MERVTRLLEMRSNKMNANSDIDEFDRSTRYALSYTERRMFLNGARWLLFLLRKAKKDQRDG